MRDIAESDWKIFKRLRELALERFCQRVLDDVARISSDTAKSSHERYLAIHRLVRERNKDIDPIFDTLRRSAAMQQSCSFRLNDLVADEELEQFSSQLATRLREMIDIYTRPMESVIEDEPSSDKTD
jgi:hypothetical protein